MSPSREAEKRSEEEARRWAEMREVVRRWTEGVGEGGASTISGREGCQVSGCITTEWSLVRSALVEVGTRLYNWSPSLLDEGDHGERWTRGIGHRQRS